MNVRFLVVSAFVSSAASALEVQYQRDVRPILSTYCFKCHGPDAETREADLRLDVREAALEALAPGKADKSEVLARVFTHDEDDVMPPPSMKKPLSESQKSILKKWIEQGAPYEPHWAYQPPKAATPPQVKWRTAAGEVDATHPVDAFIAQKHLEHGIVASEPADVETLARRLSLDLIGLPPSLEELNRFFPEQQGGRDSSKLETYIDYLMSSPHYGERWARRWLDLARYADTNGYEKDRERSIWPYRDWVVRALNADMPFDQFTIEQIAGDMLPNPTVDQLIATGFHRNTMINEEGGIDPLEFRYHAMADRVGTTGSTWLGLTLACAQCHTHKYDPITHDEYFGMMAFLNNADEPELELPDAALDKRWEENQAKAKELLATLARKWPMEQGGEAGAEKAYVAWLAEQRKTTLEWTVIKPISIQTNLPLLTQLDDGSLLGSGDITKSDTYDLSFDTGGRIVTAIRLEALPHESLPAGGPGLCYYEGPKGDFFMGEFQVLADGHAVKIVAADETYASNNFGGARRKNGQTGDKVDAVSAMAATDGDAQTGWSCAGRFGERHVAVFRLEAPVRAEKLDIRMMFGRHYACPLGRFRISVTDADGEVQASELTEEELTLLRKGEDELQPEGRQKLWQAFLMQAPELEKEVQTIRSLLKKPVGTTTMVMRERPAGHPRKTHRHHRGEFTQPKQEVQPHTISVLHPFPKELPANRLGLARWLVSRDNPLTARVMMNRQWAALFGRGLVKTVEDFGYQGELPSHPELLDYLAVQFMEQGWSLKKMHRLIVTSRTYQQSSVHRETDPTLYASAPRVRLDAEIIRDSLLRASGLLNPKMGGPGVYPPQPDSVTEAAYGAFKWKPSEGPDRYRRSLYTFMKRTAPFGMFATFDGPSGESCLVKRETSNTPLQALTTMNDVIFTEAAQALGQKTALEVCANDSVRLEWLFKRVLSRSPDKSEREMLLAFYQAQRKRLDAGEIKAETVAGMKEATVDSAAWVLVARSLFNLDEFVTRN